MASPMDYIPHGIVAALTAVITWVYREHVKHDDKRFDDIQKVHDALSEKLDTIVNTAANNHAEVLKLLIKSHGDGL